MIKQIQNIISTCLKKLSCIVDNMQDYYKLFFQDRPLKLMHFNKLS